MIGVLPCSFFAVLTGPVGVGKTFQVERLLQADVDGEPVAAPGLYVLAEASAEGTAGETLLDESRALVWPAADCEEALEAVRTCFPMFGPLTLGAARKALHASLRRRAKEAKSPPPPDLDHLLRPTSRDGVVLRALVGDTLSTLYKGSVVTGRRKLQEEADAKNRGRAGKKAAPYNDDRQSNAYAARVCKDLIDAMNGAQRHRGLVVLATVHTGPLKEVRTFGGGDSGTPAETKAVVIGECPALGSVTDVEAGITATAFSATWDALAAKANVIWHCFESTPDLRATGADEVNAAAADFGACHGVITRRGTYPGRGQVMWVKRQGGEGPLGVFASLPAVWHPSYPSAAPDPSPDLGRVLAWAVTTWRAEQAEKEGVA